MPNYWQSFLRVNENKTELFQLLAEQVTLMPTGGKIIYCTHGSNVLCSASNDDKEHIEPCIQEEADTRLVLHMSDAALKGCQQIMVRTADTDVIVLILSKMHKLSMNEIWVSFGVGKHHRYIPVHEIVSSIGPCKAKALSMFHAFTGRDVTSFFASKGKKSAWDAWNAFPDLTDTLLTLAETPECISDKTMEVLERFVVLMYDRTSELSKVNEARQHLFSRKGRSLQNIPPTQDALQQHTKHCVYQGGFVWGQCLQKTPKLPSPEEWGWERTDGSPWKPKWTTIAQAQQACYELIHCSCKKACRGLCKCFKASLKCTALCFCEGSCFHD